GSPRSISAITVQSKTSEPPGLPRRSWHDENPPGQARRLACPGHSLHTRISDTPLRALPAWVKTTRTLGVFTRSNVTSFHCPPLAVSGDIFAFATSRHCLPSHHCTAYFTGARTPPRSS